MDTMDKRALDNVSDRLLIASALSSNWLMCSVSTLPGMEN